MKKRYLQISVLFLILIFQTAFLAGCRKNDEPLPKSEGPVTLIHSEITLGKLMSVDTNIQAGDDSLLIYYYQKDTIFRFKAEEFYSPFFYQLFEDSIKLGSVEIPEFTFNHSFILNDLLPLFAQEVSDTLIEYDCAFHVFPELQLSEESNRDNGPSEGYKAIAINSGKIEIRVENTLPVDLENLHFAVVDVQYKTILKDITLARLDSGSVYTATASLLGKKFSNHFGITLYSFTSPGSDTNEVMIDLNEGLQVNLKLKNVVAIGGISKVNAQLIETKEKWIEITSAADERFFKSMYEGGSILLSVEGMKNANLVVYYTLPSVTRNELVVNDFVFAPHHQRVEKDTSRQGMSFDFSTHSLKRYNRFPVKIDVYLQASDSMINIDTSDIAEIQLSFNDFAPYYTEGYYGKKIIQAGPKFIDINPAISGQWPENILFAEPSLIFNYYNNLNMPVKILPELTALNHSTSETSELITDSVKVLYPLITGESTTTELVFDHQHSNVKDLFDIHPNQFTVEVGGRTNWNGQAENFSWDTCSFYGDLTLKLPLILQTNSLLFSDTVGINPNFHNTDTTAGKLILKVSNGFPFSMFLKLQLLDYEGETLDEVIDFGNVPSADLDESGKVIKAYEAENVLFVKNKILQNIEMAESGVIIIVSEKIGNENMPVSLYSNYKTDITLTTEKE